MNDLEDPVERLLDEAQAQGFPRRVRDPAALARIAAIIKNGDLVPARKKKAKEARTSGTFAT